MKSFWGGVIANLAVVAIVLAAYHWTLGAGAPRPAARSGDETRDLESIEKEVDRLAADVAARGAPGLASRLDARLAAMEKRLQGLEGGAPPSAAGSGGPPPADRTWTEADLAAVRTMLDELAARKVREREDQAIREQLKAAAPALEEYQVRAAAALVYTHNETIKALWREAFLGGAAKPSPEVLAKADDAKKELEQGLRAILPPDAVDKMKPNFSDLPRDAK